MTEAKINSLLQLADDEHDCAVDLARKHPRQAAYLNSQAAEKAARAICEFERKPVGITHSLGQIASLLPNLHELREAILDLDRLSSASTKFRYPNPAGRLAQPPMPADLLDDIDEVGRFIERAKHFVRNARPGSG